MSDTRKITITEQTTSVYEVPASWLEQHATDREGNPRNLDEICDDLEADAIAVELIDNHEPTEFSVTERQLTVSEAV